MKKRTLLLISIKNVYYCRVLCVVHYFFVTCAVTTQIMPFPVYVHRRAWYKTASPPPSHVSAGLYPPHGKPLGGSAQCGWHSRWSCKVCRQLVFQIPALALFPRQTSIWSSHR